MRSAPNKIRFLRVASVLLLSASLLTSPDSMRGGDKVGKFLAAARLPSPARTDASGSLANEFEISYELSKPGQPESQSFTYSKQLVNALKQRAGLVSQVLGSDKDMYKTAREYCKGKSCDVVGITETLTGDKMILTLDITSTPESHSKLHKARFNAEPHHCNPNNCSEDTCRANLIEDIVEELVALDKDHKGSK